MIPNDEILRRINEEGNILNTIVNSKKTAKGKKNMRRGSLLVEEVEGLVNRKRRREPINWKQSSS